MKRDVATSKMLTNEIAFEHLFYRALVRIFKFDQTTNAAAIILSKAG